MSDPSLNPGEVIISKAGGREYVSAGRLSAWLTLTNQRLIIQRLLGDESSYPLSQVTRASEYEYMPSPFALFPFKLLRIDFDNGGTILFGLHGLPAWIQMIEQAKASAPHISYTTAPIPLASQPSPTSMQRWVLIGVIGVSIMAFCICLPVFLWILVNLSSS